MSEQSQGPGWWVASNGKWYPPESHPNYRPPPPPPPRPAAAQRPPQQRQGDPYDQPPRRSTVPPEPMDRGPARSRPRRQKSGTSIWKVALGVCLGLFLFILACSALISSGADKVKKDIDKATAEKPAKVRVEAASDVCWSGSIGGATQEGCGNKAFDVQTDFGDFLSVAIQKKTKAGALTVVIEVEGQEKGRNSTTAEFGLVTVTTS